MENNSQSNPKVSTSSTHSEGKVLMIAVLMFIFGGVMGNMIPGMPGSQQKGSTADSKFVQESVSFGAEKEEALKRVSTAVIVTGTKEDLDTLGVSNGKEIIQTDNFAGEQLGKMINQNTQFSNGGVSVDLPTITCLAFAGAGMNIYSYNSGLFSTGNNFWSSGYCYIDSVL